MWRRCSWSSGLGALATLLVGCAAPSHARWAPRPKTTDCPEGRFVGLVPHAPEVWVDPATGDDLAPGDEAEPLRTLAEALARAPTGTVRLLPGDYTEPLRLGEGNDGLVLAGACAEAVRWSGAALAEGEALVDVEAPPEVGWELAGVSLTDAPVGLRARGGGLHLRDLAVGGHHDYALLLSGEQPAAGSLLVQGLRVDPPAEDAPGLGLVGAGGYDVELHDGEVRAAHTLGVAFQSTLDGADHVSLDGLVVEETVPWPAGAAAALFLGSGTDTRATDLGIYNTTGRGLYLGAVDGRSATATVDGLVVAGTDGPALDDLGSGISVFGSAELDCHDCALRDNTWAGLYTSGPTHVHLHGASSIRGTRADADGVGSAGLNADQGAEVQAEGLLLVGNSSRSVYAGPDAHVVLRGGRVEGGELDADGVAHGLVAVGGRLEAWGVRVRDHVGAGAMVLDDQGTGTEGRMLLGNGTVIEAVRASSEVGGGGIFALRGGELTLAGVTVVDVDAVGLLVEGDGARVEATDLAIAGVSQAWGGAWGICLADGASASIDGLFVSDVPGYGVLLLDRAELTLRDGLLVDLPGPPSGETMPAFLVESDSSAQVEGLGVERATGVAVSVRRASTLRVEDLWVEELHPDPEGAVNGSSPAAGVGVELVGGSALELLHADIAGVPGMGIYVADASDATIEDVRITGTRQEGDFDDAWAFVVLDPSTVAVHGLDVEGTRGVGAWIGEATVTGDAVTITDTSRSASGQPALGLVLTSGAAAALDGLVIDGVAGPGVSVFGGAALDCLDCEVRGVTYAGVQVEDATVVLDGGSVEGVEPDDGGLGGGVGVLGADSGEGAAHLDLLGTTVGPHPLAAVVVAGDGAWSVLGATLGGEADNGDPFGPWGQGLFAWGWPELGVAGARPWDGARGLRVEGTTFEGPNPAPALLVGASAAWCGNTLPEGAQVRVNREGAQLEGCDAGEAVPWEEGVLFEPLPPRTRYDEPDVGDPGSWDTPTVPG